jgi:putative ABC transport system permease protein
MYQGEIDEGTAYIGIFSGLFLFIAMLSVITTMTRVVKKQKIQIGTLKALGFKKRKIIMHYVGYGFWVALLGAICGIVAGRYFIGAIFLNMEMDYFEVPNGVAILKFSSYIVAFLTVLCVSLITYLTCRKELKKSPAESLRKEMPKVKSSSLNITSKGIFKKLHFASVWNLRDILRNKFRTITGIVGITGCSMLIVCAFGMLNSMNYFIKLQFEDLYNFKYKLTLKENLTDEEIKELEENYGEYTSLTLGIEVKDENGDRVQNNAFVYDAGDYIRFQDNDNNFMKLDSNDGIYVTYKLAEIKDYKIGDTIKWHIYGDNTYYESKIVGFNKDPQNQNISMTREYLESLKVKYTPDSIYTNEDLSNTTEIKNVEVIGDIESLKTSIRQMLSMMRQMVVIIIVFAILLGAVIIYNMGILSYSEKEYQFATLKVLGFKDKQIEKIYIMQNTWVSIVSIILGLFIGNYLTNWIFMEALDESYDFGAHINLSTYIIAALGTFLVSYIVSKVLSKKIKKIDMVTSLKGNE